MVESDLNIPSGRLAEQTLIGQPPDRGCMAFANAIGRARHAMRFCHAKPFYKKIMSRLSAQNHEVKIGIFSFGLPVHDISDAIAAEIGDVYPLTIPQYRARAVFGKKADSGLQGLRCIGQFQPVIKL